MDEADGQLDGLEDLGTCEQHNRNTIIFIKLDPFGNVQCYTIMYIYLSLHLKRISISIWITNFIGFQCYGIEKRVYLIHFPRYKPLYRVLAVVSTVTSCGWWFWMWLTLNTNTHWNEKSIGKFLCAVEATGHKGQPARWHIANGEVISFQFKLISVVCVLLKLKVETKM